MGLKKTILDSIRTLDYLVRSGIKEGYGNPFKDLKRERTNSVYVLANGPSLKTFMESWKNCPEKYMGQDFVVVNDFVKYPMYEELRPKYVTMSDPLFFENTVFSERGISVMKTLAEKTTWEILFFIPSMYQHGEYLNYVRTNKNIRIVPIHSMRYKGLESVRLWLYKHGRGNGEFGTVALNAIYGMLMLGYKEVNVLGIDHNFFDSIAVNSQNVLCKKGSHFYAQESQWKPIISHFKGASQNKPFTVAAFLMSNVIIFTGHMIMDNFAKQIGAKIYNCTPNSMVDAYERKVL